MENSSFEKLAEDLQMEILSRLPLKSLGKFILVSKKWASLIRSKELRKRYLRQSMTRPRVLFLSNSFEHNRLFHFVYPEKVLVVSSGQQQIRFSVDTRREISQPIRGLICMREATKVVIYNPGTKKFRNLPEIQAHKEARIRSFFGYDEAEDVFKVLCMTETESDGPSKGAKEHQLFTMGLSEKSWRLITCKHDHSPVTEGLCKGGVLYYGARSSCEKSVLMSFNVSSEDFTVIELSEEVKIYDSWRLVNYKGDIALVDEFDFHFEIVDESNGNKVFNLWVRNEITGNWSKNSIGIPHWEEVVEDREFYFEGTTGTGQLVFSEDSVTEGQFFVLYYDTCTTNLKRVEIEEMAGDYRYVRTFLDHVDSTWLIDE